MELFKSISNKVLLFLLINLLFTALLLFAVAKPLLDRNTVKGWLEESVVYDQVVNAFLSNAGEQPAEESELDAEALDITRSTNGAISQAELTTAVEEVITPEYIQSQVETVIDGFYDIAEGKTESPEFTIGLTEKRDELIDRLSLLLKENLSQLPACGPGDTIPTPETDPFEITCIPPNVNADIFVDAYTAELRNNPEFLGDVQTTGDEIFKDNTQNPQNAYKGLSTVLWLVPLFAVLVAVGAVFTAKNPIRGVRGVAITAALAGLAGFVLFWIFDRSRQFVIDQAVSGGDFGTLQDFAETGLSSLYEVAIGDVAYSGLIYSSIMMIVGALIGGGIYLYERRNREESEPTKIDVEKDGNQPEPEPEEAEKSSEDATSSEKSKNKATKKDKN